jgi:hypothetical protein
MTPTNGSDDLSLRLIAIFIALLIAGFMIPLETLDNNQLSLLWVVMPFVGWLWIQNHIDAAKGN